MAEQEGTRSSRDKRSSKKRRRDDERHLDDRDHDEYEPEWAGIKTYVEQANRDFRAIGKALRDETELTVRDVRGGTRLEHLVYDQICSVLDAREIGGLTRLFIDGTGWNLAEILGRLEAAVQDGVQEGVQEGIARALEQQGSSFQHKKPGKDPGSSIISTIAGLMFSSIHLLPDKNRNTEMDETKHVFFKAGLVMYQTMGNTSGNVPKFKAELATRLKTKKSEVLKRIRVAMFESLDEAATKTMEKLRDKEPITLQDIREVLYITWRDQVDGKGEGVFAAEAFQSIRDSHEIPQASGEHERRFRTLQDIYGLDSPKDFDNAVVLHVMFCIVRWCLETIDKDRQKHFVEVTEDMDSSEGLARTPDEEVHWLATREGDGFDAPGRLRQWIQAYAAPASGGGKKGDGKKKSGNDKSRQYLEVDDDQVFNKKVMTLLGGLSHRLEKKHALTPDTVTTVAEANQLLRPYLSGATTGAPAQANS